MDDYRKINSSAPSKEYKDNLDKVFNKKREKESDLEEKTNRKEPVDIYLQRGGTGNADPYTR